MIAELYSLEATTVAGVLQYAADDLDQQAKAGERP